MRMCFVIQMIMSNKLRIARAKSAMNSSIMTAQ